MTGRGWTRWAALAALLSCAALARAQVAEGVPTQELPPIPGVPALPEAPSTITPRLPHVSENPFEDIPAGHPAYAAIQKLVDAGIMEGYPDGSFKGGRVITRYELAQSMARTLARVEALKAQGRPISPEEQALIDQLQAVVGRELQLMGIRVTGLERRIQSIEGKEHVIEEKKSNLTISGFYRIQDGFVFQPFDFSDYPFLREVNPFFNVRDRGLLPLQQEVFLRFAGHPVIDELPSTTIDAFAELRGLLVGNGGEYLVYDFSHPPIAGGASTAFPAAGPPIPGGTRSDVPSAVQDDAHLFFNRAHFVTRSKDLTLRVFSNESATDLTDPSVLFTVDTLAPFSGVETNGGIRKFSYSGSVLKDERLDQATGVDPTNITTFSPQNIRSTDIYTLRLTYEPFKDHQEHHGKQLLLGGTYVEHAFDYTVPWDRDRVIGYDARYTLRRESTLDTVGQVLFSQGRGDVTDKALKLDSTYTKKGFLANLKFYHYGPNFDADVAQNQFVDTDVLYNFRRAATRGLVPVSGILDPTTRGERLTRLQLKDDFASKDLAGIEHLTLSSLWEIKSWGANFLNPLFNDEEHSSRFNVQALADITKRWHLELTSEVIKPVRIDHLVQGIPDAKVLGTLVNTAHSEWKIQKNLSMVTEVELKEDQDSPDIHGQQFAMDRFTQTAAWQATPRFFLKGTYENISNSDVQLLGLPAFPINGRLIRRRIGEINWVPWRFVSLKELYVNQLTKNSGLTAPNFTLGNIPVEDNSTNIFVTELDFNFTPALKARYINATQDTNLFFTGLAPLFLSDVNAENNFAEIVYTPSIGTELRATYGYEYENPNDPLDNGPAKFWKSIKIFQLKAQTDF